MRIGEKASLAGHTGWVRAVAGEVVTLQTITGEYVKVRVYPEPDVESEEAEDAKALDGPPHDKAVKGKRTK